MKRVSPAGILKKDLLNLSNPAYSGRDVFAHDVAARALSHIKAQERVIAQLRKLLPPGLQE